MKNELGIHQEVNTQLKEVLDNHLVISALNHPKTDQVDESYPLNDLGFNTLLINDPHIRFYLKIPFADFLKILYPDANLDTDYSFFNNQIVTIAQELIETKKDYLTSLQQKPSNMDEQLKKLFYAKFSPKYILDNFIKNSNSTDNTLSTYVNELTKYIQVPFIAEEIANKSRKENKKEDEIKKQTHMLEELTIGLALKVFYNIKRILPRDTTPNYGGDTNRLRFRRRK